MARERKEYPVYLIKVSKERCTGCGQCFDLCPVSVFEFPGGTAVPSRPENCLGCGTCEAVCEQKAVVVTEI
jgi:NAD-dependent dihydropyrimidine dehydrogenase PreA subunit